MKIDSAQVDHIARLSRLALSENEKQRYGDQLNNILTYIEKLGELDTTKIEPTFHVFELANVKRPDRLYPSLTTDEALANAPDPSGGFYRVPSIIE